MIKNKLEELEIAKKNVLWLLDNAGGLVDYKDIVYWSGLVLRLREEITKI